MGKYIQSMLPELVSRAKERGIELVVFDDAAGLGHPYSLKGQVRMWHAIRRARVDRMYYTHFSVVPYTGVPFVVTIHDLIMTHFSSRATSTRGAFWFTVKRGMYSWIMRYAVRASSAIITNTHFVAHDIVKTYRANPKKIHVIYPGVPVLPSPGVLPAALQGKKFVVCVGSVYPHKNVQVLLDAMEHVSGIYVALIGAHNEFRARIAGARKHTVLMTGYLEDAQLAACYAHCSAFVQPSRMEGFGFPALEAYAYGAPLIVSDIPAHHEVLGDCAQYFNPDDSVALADMIRVVASRSNGAPRIPQPPLPREYSFARAAELVWKLVAQ